MSVFLNMFTLVQAAAHGLPLVATKNGGPVDIHRVIEELTLYIYLILCIPGSSYILQHVLFS